MALVDEERRGDYEEDQSDKIRKRKQRLSSNALDRMKNLSTYNVKSLNVYGESLRPMDRKAEMDRGMIGY